MPLGITFAETMSGPFALDRTSPERIAANVAYGTGGSTAAQR
jgi:hypothetical protein